MQVKMSGKKQHHNEESMLELRNLSKDFGGLRAVSGVDLTIHKGELHCLIGPNGAGKSTIFNLIMGVYPSTEGEVIFKGQNITKLSTWQRARLGMSIKMQIPGVYGELSGYDNMRIAAQNYIPANNIDNEIERLTRLIEIEHLMDQEVSNLSHGQQQWLEIAMALASSPDLLLLDEPAAGMGPEETEFTARIVKRLNENGVTIIFIDHDMEFVRQISQRVTVLHQGKLFAEGTIEDVESNEDVIRIYLGSND